MPLTDYSLIYSWYRFKEFTWHFSTANEFSNSWFYSHQFLHCESKKTAPFFVETSSNLFNALEQLLAHVYFNKFGTEWYHHSLEWSTYNALWKAAYEHAS